MREKRVAIYVCGDLQLGGAERRFFRLFEYLQERENRVYLYTSENGIKACQSIGIKLEKHNVHVFSGLDKATPRVLGYTTLVKHVLSLVKQIRKDKICHLHFGQNPGPLSFLYSMIAQFACTFSISLVDSIKDYQRSNRQKLYVIVTARFSAKIDCLSSQIRSDLCLFLGKKYEHKCLVSPCSFTDLKAAFAANVSAEETRDIDISMIARMTPGKGHALLRNALDELVREKRSGLIVHICGSGPLESEVKNDFQAVDGHEIQIRFEQDPFRILRRTKVYVSLQDTENYPSQSLLEAMACGCAIIATDVGLTRLLLDESCARLIPPDPVSLAEAIRCLLDQDALRRELGQNAQAVVASKHSIERFADYFMTDVSRPTEYKLARRQVC